MSEQQVVTKPQAETCWCGSSQYKVVARAKHFQVHRCLKCGTHANFPRPISELDESKEFYDSYYESETGQTASTPTHITPKRESALTSRFWRVVEKHPELLDGKKGFLDIGCGVGTLCSEVEGKVEDPIAGFDLSGARIEIAKRNYPQFRFLCSAVEEFDEPDELFGVICMDNVIEHLIDPCETLKAVGKLLDANGSLVIITPNMDSGHFRLLGKRWTPELGPHAHVFLFDAPSLQHCVHQAGLIVQASGSFHGQLMPIPALAMRFLKGDFKGACWRSMMDSGGLYGRLIGKGEMLYAVVGKQQYPSESSRQRVT